MRIIIAVILFFSLIPNLLAQDSTSVDFQTWSDFTSMYHFNEKWTYSGDYGLRGVVSGEDWTKIYARPTFRYRISPSSDTRGSLGLFYTRDSRLIWQLETRFAQEINLKWPNIPGFTFNQKLRIEERFFIYAEEDNDFSARARYHFNLETPDFKVFNIPGSFFGLAGLQLFIPLGDQSTEKYINKYRLQGGLGYRPGPKFKYEAMYIRQNSYYYEVDGYVTDEDIFRVRVYYNINVLP